MERAGRLIRNRQVSRELVSAEDLARAAWPTAVGKVITAYTLRIKLVRSNLIVEVADAVWQRQLHSLSQQILERLVKVTGSPDVQSIEFRVGLRRREQQRASARESVLFAGETTSPDEAEGIHDAVLKKVYRLSRKKATA